MVLLAGGVALAANVQGTGGNDDVRHSFGDDVIYGGPGKDLIDCAYLENRTGDAGDTAYAARGEDTVVDCKTVIYSDPTDF